MLNWRRHVSKIRSIVLSNKACDLGQPLGHRISSHFDARGIQPGMGIERFCLSLRCAKMHDARNPASLKHRMRGDRLRQAHRAERHVTSRARDCPTDIFGKSGLTGTGFFSLSRTRASVGDTNVPKRRANCGNEMNNKATRDATNPATASANSSRLR